MYCKCGGAILYYEPVLKVYDVLTNGYVDYESGYMIYDVNLDYLGEAECQECLQKYKTKTVGNNIKIIN